MSNAISVQGLSKRYGKVQSLSDVSFSIPAGSISGFLGENGAGKSTTLRILAGLTHPSAGGASVNGVPVTSEGGHRLHLGYLAQEPRFYGWMSAREVLRYVASFHGPVDSGYVEQLLLRVGISEAADRPTAGFSGGMRQRLGIAQALVGRPAVVLLDEPASALDPVGRAEVLELLRDLRGETTIFYSTHILADVERVSDHVTVLHQGRLVASAPTGELLGRFTAGQLLIRTRGENDLSVALRDLPGVRELASSVEGGELRSYELTAEPGALGEIQRRVTQLAAERGLALLSNEERRLDLEAVFLRLIGVGPVDKVA